MRTGVGHCAPAQVLDQVFQFTPGERVVGFDGMTANGFRNDMLSESGRIDLLSGRLELVHQFNYKPAGIGYLHKGRQRIQQKCAVAKLTQTDPEPGKHEQLLSQEDGIAGR